MTQGLQSTICKFLTQRLLYTITVLFTHGAWGHPVAFKGSKGVMGYHSPNISHVQLNYSFEHWWATGVHHISIPNSQDPRHATLASINFLIQRWNGHNYQANLYANLGGGMSELSGDPKTVGYAFAQLDIEDRDYYFLAKHVGVFGGEQKDLCQQTIRAGITPYVEKFEGIHSWLILEFQHNEFFEGRTFDELTPYLRIFYRNMLFEIGQSFQGNTRFNYISHF